MGLTTALLGLTSAYQHPLSALHGLISSATQPPWAYQQRHSANMGLSAALLSQHGLISSVTQPNKGLSAPPFSLTWTYQHRLSA